MQSIYAKHLCKQRKKQTKKQRKKTNLLVRLGAAEASISGHNVSIAEKKEVIGAVSRAAAILTQVSLNANRRIIMLTLLCIRPFHKEPGRMGYMSQRCAHTNTV